MHEEHLVGEAGEEQGLFQRRVTTADDRDLLAAEEEAVTGGARRQAVTDQSCLGVEAEHQGPRPGGDDHRAGAVHRAVDVDLERADVEVDRGRLLEDQLGTEALGLLAEVLHQLRPLHATGEPGEVLHLGGEHELAARLVAGARRLTLEHERREVGAGGVDRRGQPGWAGPDDDDVAHVGLGGAVAHVEHCFFRVGAAIVRSATVASSTTLRRGRGFRRSRSS